MGDATDTARDLLDGPFHRATGIETRSATPESAHTCWPFEGSDGVDPGAEAHGACTLDR